MAKKKLLSEAQVRRFMGLAGLGSLKENMYTEEEMDEASMNEESYSMNEKEMEEDLYKEEDDSALDADMEGDKMEDPEPMSDEGVVNLDSDLVNKLPGAIDVFTQISSALGAEEAEMPDPMMDDEVADDDTDDDIEDDTDAMEPATDDADLPEDEGVIKEALRGINLELSGDELVNEVARRVAKRILKAKRAKSQLDEALGTNNNRRRPYRRSTKK